MIFQELPTPCELGERPELAALAVLETSLEIVAAALAAAQPDLPFLDEHPSPPPSLAVARAILHQADALQVLIESYCRLTAPPPPGHPTLVHLGAD